MPEIDFVLFGLIDDVYHYLSQPTDANLEAYLREFKAVNVTDIVRATECSYSTDRIVKLGVQVHVRPLRVAPLGTSRLPLFPSSPHPRRRTGRAIPRWRPPAGRRHHQVAWHLQGCVRQCKPCRPHHSCALRGRPGPRARPRRHRAHRERHGAATGCSGTDGRRAQQSEAHPHSSSPSPPLHHEVQAIRAQRRGAINQRQLAYLEHSYKKRGDGKCCSIM